MKNNQQDIIQVYLQRLNRKPKLIFLDHGLSNSMFGERLSPGSIEESIEEFHELIAFRSLIESCFATEPPFWRQIPSGLKFKSLGWFQSTPLETSMCGSMLWRLRKYHKSGIRPLSIPATPHQCSFRPGSTRQKRRSPSFTNY